MMYVSVYVVIYSNNAIVYHYDDENRQFYNINPQKIHLDTRLDN